MGRSREEEEEAEEVEVLVAKKHCSICNWAGRPGQLQWSVGAFAYGNIYIIYGSYWINSSCMLAGASPCLHPTAAG